MSRYTNLDLQKIAWELRIKTFKSLYNAQSGHVGPCLSMAEILSCLFFDHMKMEKDSDLNDFFVLSKGHGVTILYSVYAQMGWIDEDELYTLRKVDSRLQGHPDKMALNYLDAGTGALGQGLSIAIGYALSSHLKKDSKNSFCIVGDGEMQEGQIWEGILYAGVKKIENLCLIIDNNKFQNEVSVKDTMGNIEFKQKILSFGWNYLSIDGHSVEEITNALNSFQNSQLPTVIDAHTVKGKGVDFMENNNEWHSKTLNKDQFDQAVTQCKEKINAIN